MNLNRGQIIDDTDKQNEQALNTFELKENNENEVKRQKNLKKCLKVAEKMLFRKVSNLR